MMFDSPAFKDCICILPGDITIKTFKTMQHCQLNKNAMQTQWNIIEKVDWLVVSTSLKNISQIGNLPQIGVKMKNIRVATT